MLPNLIVPTLSRYDLLQGMVRSIDYPVQHLLIVDNGGELDNLFVPQIVEQVTILNMPNPQGVATSWNLGVKCFPHDPYWLIVSDDVTFHPGTLELLHDVSGPESFVQPDEWPFFQFFTVGEDWVTTVGLFDEGFHPANFEDDEYQWRAGQHMMAMTRIGLPHNHVKQGTVFAAGNALKNARTYPENESWFETKKAVGDLSDGGWSLSRRRRLSWD